MHPKTEDNGLKRTFSTGATRDTAEDKLDFEGFLSPLVLEAFAAYMHVNRTMRDGSLRDSDNWQKGIPRDQYIKSAWRHFFAVWKKHRMGGDSMQDLMALLFNVQGYAHELLKEQAETDECIARWYADVHGRREPGEVANCPEGMTKEEFYKALDK